MNVDEFLKNKGVVITLASEHALVEMMEEYATLKAYELLSEAVQKIDKVIKRYEDDIQIGLSGEYHTKIRNLISHFQQETAKAISTKKSLLDDCTVYFRSVVMLAESVGMAETHAEKSARLRGLVQLLESAIVKLRNSQGDELMHNWQYFDFNISDYPYRAVLRNLQQENQEMKRRLGEDIGKELEEDF